MSELQEIQQKLLLTARRHRWQRGWRGFWRGFLVAGVVWLLGLAVYKLFPVPEAVMYGAFLAGWLGPVIGFLRAYARPFSLDEAARWLDLKQHFKERLSTALEMADKEQAGEWRDLLLHDAAAHAREIDLRNLLPFHLPKAAQWSLLLLVIIAGLGFVPEYRSQEYRQRKQEQAVMKEVGAQVAALTKRQMTNRPPALQKTQEAMDATMELGEQLKKATLKRDEAIKKIAEMTDKLKEQAKELASNPGLQRMQQAARSDSPEAATPEDMMKKIEALQEALGKNSADEKTYDKLQKELEKLQKAASDMAAQNGAAKAQAMQGLSQAMSQFMQQAEVAGVDIGKMEEAMAALQAGQTDKVLKDLQAAFQDLDKMKELAQALQNMQSQMQQMGKDLKEQLERGQAPLAQKSLQEMIEKLNSGEMTPQQMQEMMKQLQQAQKPSELYGDMSKFMQQAMNQMQQGDKKGAAQSLAQAKKELDEMMKQMGDMESLVAALGDLKTAKECLGNSQSWGQCNGRGRGGWGSRNVAGMGMPDEMAAWFYHEQYYTDSKGGLKAGYGVHGKWSEADVNVQQDVFTPSKIKGQITPGGPMPSITLKGVSIKGQSSVAFEEAATAAQSEAESALTQDKVPRAYQGTVKDYFDDFKR